MSIERTAEYLAGLRLRNERVDSLPQEHMPENLQAAYAAQCLLVDRLRTAWGGERAGFKIALTNSAAQTMLGVPHPVFGQLLSSRVHKSGVTLDAADYIVRLIECEFGFRLARDVPASDAPYSRDSIAEFVGSVVPAIELVEHHFAAIDRVTAHSLAADNAIHGAWIHGDEINHWRDIDLAAQSTRLIVNGKESLCGAGNKVLGHPLEALAWLANALPAHELCLRAGDFVTTGVTTDEIYPAAAGDTLVAELGAAGTVQLTFR